MEKLKRILKRIKRIFRIILLFFGSLSLTAVILSFTDYPYIAYYRLGHPDGSAHPVPDYIFIYSGGGMPAPETMMRLYYGVKTAQRFPEAKLIVAMPCDSIEDETAQIHMMEDELIIHGIEKERILREYEGSNTYYQSVNMLKMINADTNTAVTVVTSPQHIYRTVQVLKATGIKQVGYNAAMERCIPEELLEKSEDDSYVNPNMRYNVWNYLKYELTVSREYCAIVYYYIRGWI